MVDISRCDDVIIQDRTIFEDARIFAPNLHAMGLMSTRDFENYTDLFDLMMSLVSPPDLLIYLKCDIPHLVSQIQKRGRDYEQTMSLDYLRGLNDRYEEFIAQYKGEVLTIDKGGLDFENNPADFASITDKIDARLYGLF